MNKSEFSRRFFAELKDMLAGAAFPLMIQLIFSVSFIGFITSLYDLDRPVGKDLSQTDSFLAVICIAGSGTMVGDEGGETPLRQGETLLVPASCSSVRFVPDGAMKVLTSRMA